MVMHSAMTKNRMFVILAAVRKAKEIEEKCLLVTEKVEDLWHKRYGHLNYRGLRSLAEKEMVKGIPKLANGEEEATCEVCLKGKQIRGSIPKESAWKSTYVLQLVHRDLCRPIQPVFSSGKRYILNFIDDFSRKCWTYLLTEKSETLQFFKTFKAETERESGQKLICLRSDRGGEYNSREFEEYCREFGIKR